MKLAIYDFDGTLFERETLPFIVKYYQKNGYSKRKLAKFYIHITRLLAVYKLKLDPTMDKEKFRAKAAMVFMYLFEEFSKEDLKTFFRHCTTEIVKDFNPGVLADMKEKKAAGYHTVICSGANTLLLGEVSKHVPVDTVIGTELHFTDRDRFDFHAAHRIITGKNKPLALLESFDRDKVDWDQSFAFGDSYYDVDILSLTGNPVAVNPDDQLRAIAAEKGWTIMDASAS